jgi:hypothetical protein
MLPAPSGPWAPGVTDNDKLTTLTRLPDTPAALDAPTPAPHEAETVELFGLRVLGAYVHRCPHFGQERLRPIRALPPLPRATAPPFLRWAA